MTDLNKSVFSRFYFNWLKYIDRCCEICCEKMYHSVPPYHPYLFVFSSTDYDKRFERHSVNHKCAELNEQIIFRNSNLWVTQLAVRVGKSPRSESNYPNQVWRHSTAPLRTNAGCSYGLVASQNSPSPLHIPLQTFFTTYVMYHFRCCILGYQLRGNYCTYN